MMKVTRPGVARWRLATRAGGIAVGIFTLVLFSLSLGLEREVRAQPSALLNGSKTFAGGASELLVESGLEFEYAINFRCASVINNCLDAEMSDVLDGNLEFVSASAPPDLVDSLTHNPGTNEVLVDFIEPLPAGSTGQIRITVRFPPGTTPGITATNRVTSTTMGNPPEVTDPVTATVDGTFEMFANKAFTGDVDDFVIDENGDGFVTTYQLQICSPDSIGGVELDNPRITDTLPAEATFVSASDGGVYNPTLHEVSWTHVSDGGGLPDSIPVGGCFEVTLNVAFDPNGPDGIPSTADDADPGDVVTNSFDVTGDPADGSPPVLLTDPLTQILAPPSGAASPQKSSTSPSTYAPTGLTEELPGGPITYTLEYANVGTLIITDVTVVDLIPAGILLQEILIGPASDGVVDGFYMTNLTTTWQALPGNSYAALTTVPTSSLGLAPTETVTAIRYDLGDFPLGSAWSDGGFTSIVSPSITPELLIENCVTVTGTIQGDTMLEDLVESDCETINVIDARSIPEISKSAIDESGANISSLEPLDVFTYVLDIGNDGVAQQALFAPITLTDLVPSDLIVVVPGPGAGDGTGWQTAAPTDTWFAYSANDGAPIPTSTLISSFSGTQTLAEFAWPGADLAPGAQRVISFAVKVRVGTPPSVISNQGTFAWDPATLNPLQFDCEGAAANACADSVDTPVVIAPSARSEKFVRGETSLDLVTTDFKKFDETIEGGDVDWKIVITNTSNITASELIVYDIFPYVSDTGVIDPSARGSEWKPILHTPISAPTGIPLIVEYSLSTNPCRPEVVPSGPPGCVDDWTTTFPSTTVAEISAVRLLFCNDEAKTDCLELGPDSETVPGGVVEFGWHMVAPNSLVSGTIAWNSFGFAMNVGGEPLLPSEPIRVGIRGVSPDLRTGATVGNFVFFDVQGQQDDGIQQPVEPGVNNVRVELWDFNGGTPVLVDYRYTGDNFVGDPGYYLFEDVVTGTYFTRFFPPDGYTVSPPNEGGDDALDSDGEAFGTDPIFGDYYDSTTFSVVSGTDDRTWDFGIWLDTDYGDAPYDGGGDLYPTQASLLVSPALAARHVISPGLSLGGVVDDETDGQPQAKALGDDDGSAGDDEDGVAFPEFIQTAARPVGILSPGSNPQLTISATVPPGEDAFLNAWIDWNGDGDWDDAGEQIATDVTVVSGTQTLSILVPVGAVTGTTHARFRLSTEEGLLPTGTALDGEVEDYAVFILAPPVKSLIATSEAHTDGADPEQLVVGEIARYRVEIPVPEGVMPGFVITEVLSPGLQFIDDGTATLALVSTDGMTSTDTALDAAAVSGDGSTLGTITPTFVIPGANISPASPGSGDDPVFSLGDVTNPDADADLEYVVLEHNVIVVNELAVQDGLLLTDRFDVQFGTALRSTEVITVEVVEPVLTIDKSLDVPAVLGPGSPVTYTLVVTHDGITRADAFDVVITDPMPSELINVTVVSVTADISPIPTSSVTSNLVRVPGGTAAFDLPQGAAVTVTITADIGPSVTAGTFITNPALVGWTTLPDDGTPGNPTGSLPPGNSGDADGERNGDGGVNDQLRSDLADFFINAEWGDLPDFYPTLLADGGAAHLIPVTGNVRLGLLLDADIDGQPNIGADGDDTDGDGDDEDGIVFLDPLQPGQPSRVQVTTSGAGFLNAWFDFDGDGILGAGEQVALDAPLPAGTSIITVTPPFAPISTTVYSRFRYTTDPGDATTPGGNAFSGEVEDYALMSLGDLLWNDNGVGGGTPDDGILNGAEPPLPFVEVQLYRVGDSVGVDPPRAATTTDASGNYIFTGLEPDDYIVYIPPSQFAVGAPLEGFFSSTGDGDPNLDLDEGMDESGLDSIDPATTGIASAPVTLTPAGEPTGEDGDSNSNLTVDFGFTPATDLTIDKDCVSESGDPDFVNAGERWICTVSIENLGPNDAPNMRVTDTVGAGLLFSSETDTCVFSAGTGVDGRDELLCRPAGTAPDWILPVGSTAAFSIAFAVPFDYDDDFAINDAAVDQAGIELDPNNNSTRHADIVRPLAPTGVSVIRFEAAADEETVTIEWETASELDQSGFRLMRVATVAGRWEEVGELVPSRGGASRGASYRVDDRPGEGRWIYRLEAVALDGGVRDFGPVEVSVSPQPRIYLPYAMLRR